MKDKIDDAYQCLMEQMFHVMSDDIDDETGAKLSIKKIFIVGMDRKRMW